MIEIKTEPEDYEYHDLPKYVFGEACDPTNSSVKIEVKAEPYVFGEAYDTTNSSAKIDVKAETYDIQIQQLASINQLETHFGFEDQPETSHLPEVPDPLDQNVYTVTSVAEKEGWSCDICHKEFNLKRSLTIHQKFNMCLNRNECSICKKKFPDKSTLNQHKVKSHKFTYKHFCDRCNMSFISFDELDDHKQSTNCGYIKILNNVHNKTLTENILICKMCNKIFSSEEILLKHSTQCAIISKILLANHSSTAFKCQICNVLCETRELVYEHCKKAHCIYVCDECAIVFNSEQSLSYHNDQIHKIKIINIKTVRRPFDLTPVVTVPEQPIPHVTKSHKVYRCPKCDKFFKNPQLLGHHKKQAHPLKCMMCNVTVSMYNGDFCIVCDRVMTKFRCKFCGVGFYALNWLAKHRNHFHLDLTPYHCDKCDMKYRELDELQSHVKLHGIKYICICHICRQKFTNTNALYWHIQAHKVAEGSVCSARKITPITTDPMTPTTSTTSMGAANASFGIGTFATYSNTKGVCLDKVKLCKPPIRRESFEEKASNNELKYSSSLCSRSIQLKISRVVGGDMAMELSNSVVKSEPMELIDTNSIIKNEPLD